MRQRGFTVFNAHPLRRLGVAALCLIVLACTTTRQTKFFHPNADLGVMKKVAVLPFDNVTQDKAAGEKCQKIFFIELLAAEAFDVVEPGQVTKTLKSQGAESMGPADFQRVGKELGVDGLFLGSVIDFEDARSGSTPAPEVTIQLRLVETQTGATVWSTSETRSGAAVSTRLFGVGGESLTEAARRVIRGELRTLFK